MKKVALISIDAQSACMIQLANLIYTILLTIVVSVYNLNANITNHVQEQTKESAMTIEFRNYLLSYSQESIDLYNAIERMKEKTARLLFCYFGFRYNYDMSVLENKLKFAIEKKNFTDEEVAFLLAGENFNLFNLQFRNYLLRRIKNDE